MRSLRRNSCDHNSGEGSVVPQSDFAPLVLVHLDVLHLYLGRDVAMTRAIKHRKTQHNQCSENGKHQDNRTESSGMRWRSHWMLLLAINVSKSPNVPIFICPHCRKELGQGLAAKAHEASLPWRRT